MSVLVVAYDKKVFIHSRLLRTVILQNCSPAKWRQTCIAEVQYLLVSHQLLLLKQSNVCSSQHAAGLDFRLRYIDIEPTARLASAFILARTHGSQKGLQVMF